jgi:hypothetical protein
VGLEYFKETLLTVGVATPRDELGKVVLSVLVLAERAVQISVHQIEELNLFRIIIILNW